MKIIRITDEAYCKLKLIEELLDKDHSEAIKFLVDYYIRNEKIKQTSFL